MRLRPAAVPLITVDPYFSIWSCNDNLYDDTTKHWTGRPIPIVAGIQKGNMTYSMGATKDDLTQINVRIPQKDLKITPLSTVYTFENKLAKVKLTFTTPLLLNRLDILSRPVSYIAYEIEPKCNPDELEFVFGINSRCCVNTNQQRVAFSKTNYSLCCGNVEQIPLSTADDLITIDWGYLHLCDTDAYPALYDNKLQRLLPADIDKEYNVYKEMPYLVVKSKKMSGVFTVAYDAVKAVEYFGQPLDEYYKKYFKSFEDMAKTAVNEYTEVKNLCDAFDAKLLSEAGSLGENYKAIISLAYRQAIAAHKLAEDENGEILFLSKECASNGCVGTLDVTYPSIPLFLKYNPELVKGMLRPIIRYAKTDAWRYKFTPHDVGTYPLANGQVYGMKHNDASEQMPVEETGNMLLCLAAMKKYGGDTELFDAEDELMKKWVDYLVENGYDPGNQLCTDDFAGHLAQNCNLSLKAILGIAAYSYLSGDDGYMEIAQEYAKKWEEDAKASNGATRLTFDNPDGWSIKYNMVWDNLLRFGLFTDEVKKNEIKLYNSKLDRYGVPLDCRESYTKLDWLMWSTCIFDDKEYFDAVCESIVKMINETTDRVPLTDWYDTASGMCCGFRNRTVVGGVFINLL